MPTPVGVNWKKRELGLGRREKKTLTQQELELFARTFLEKQMKEINLGLEIVCALVSLRTTRTK